MSKYKGIDKETILKVKDVRFPLARKDVEIDLTGLTDSFDRLRNALESHQNKVTNDTEMSIICEMAMKYLDEFKAMDDNKTEAYNKGLEDGRNEVWEMAKKIVLNPQDGGLSIGELKKMFGFGSPSMILIRYTMQEAHAKLEAYENEIKVGDVVRLKGSDKEYVVTTIDEDRCSEIYCGVSKDGAWFAQCNVEKTGKHIDIQSVLQQIKEGDSNA